MIYFHTTPIEINFGSNTEGFFSFEQAENLIIFIHGFGGNAMGTWKSFHTYLLADVTFATSDIIFYGYNTFEGQAGDHSAELYDFINQVQNPIHNSILPVNQRLVERKYKRTILVAHSLGAVLARQAQLLASNSGNSWVNKSELVLFAPAHHGAKIIPLAMQSLPGLSSLLGIFAKFKFPILNDLNSEEDGILKSIKKETEDLLKENKGDFSKAKLVVYAKGDKVVRNIPYLKDAPPKVLNSKSHTSVCKPKDAFLQPYELLKKIIK